MANLEIQIVALAALRDNYIWAITHPQQRSMLVIDPGEASPVLDYLQQQELTLQGILLTHHHWDHVNGVAELVRAHPAPVYGSQENPYQGVTHRLVDQERVKINDYFPSFACIAIPGHTLDHLAYYSEGLLFCGDTLFAAGCGRLFEGTPAQMYDSLQKLATLPGHTQVYCAHEYTLDNLRFAHQAEPSNSHILQRMHAVEALRKQGLPSIPATLSEELQTNPFLRCDVTEIKQQAEQYSQQSLPDPIAVFAALREWKNSFA